ncbi:hypothetical protein D3C85_1553640 [compost metagenome]
MHHDLPSICHSGGFAQGRELLHRILADDIAVVCKRVMVDVGEAHAAFERRLVHMQQNDLGLWGNGFCQFDGAQ